MRIFTADRAAPASFYRAGDGERLIETGSDGPPIDDRPRNAGSGADFLTTDFAGAGRFGCGDAGATAMLLNSVPETPVPY